MLIGIGTDILLVERFRRSLLKFGPEYLEEAFSDEELARYAIPADKTGATYFARAFCAKEACAKALGTGIDENVYWFDFSVDQRTWPVRMSLTGGALARLTALTPCGTKARLFVDVASNDGIAQAQVAIFAYTLVTHNPV